MVILMTIAVVPAGVATRDLSARVRPDRPGRRWTRIIRIAVNNLAGRAPRSCSGCSAWVSSSSSWAAEIDKVFFSGSKGAGPAGG